MKRSELIDDYLRANDPLGPVQAGAPIAPAAAERATYVPAGPTETGDGRSRSRSASAPSRRRSIFVAATAVAVAGGIAVAVIGPPLLGGDGLLSPEAAVAAVSADLGSPQILHWRTTQAQDDTAVMKPLPAHFHGAFDLWLNAKTGATHLTLDFPRLTKVTDGESDRLEEWTDGKQTTWTSAKPSAARRAARISIDKVVYPPSRPITRWSPLDQVHRTLAAAAAGKATLSDGGAWHGIPVTKVTAQQPQVKLTTWIVRAQDPWILKTASEQRTPTGALMSRVITTTRMWQVFELTDASAEHHLAPPVDPAKYDVKLSSMWQTGGSGP